MELSIIGVVYGVGALITLLFGGWLMALVVLAGGLMFAGILALLIIGTGRL